MIEFKGCYYCECCLKEYPEGAGECPDCKGVSSKPIADALPAGTVLAGRYLIGNPLGRGAFGITYLAMDTTLQRKTAVKEYAPQGKCSREGFHLFPEGEQNGKVFEAEKARFWNEAAITFGLFDIPGIGCVFDCFEDNNTVYMIQEYLPGGTLAEKVKSRNKGLGESETLIIFSDVINGLGKLHSLGILHLDISPDNLMFDSEGKLRLIDFGISSFKDTRSAFAWKPGYSSPEQLSGEMATGPWSDIYSLASTMYYAMTGRTPFGYLRKKLNASPAPMNRYCEVSEETERAIVRALSPLVATRYFTVGMFAEALGYKNTGNIADKTLRCWSDAWLSATTSADPVNSRKKIKNMGYMLRIHVKRVAVFLLIMTMLAESGILIWQKADRFGFISAKARASQILHPENRGLNLELCKELIESLTGTDELELMGKDEEYTYGLYTRYEYSFDKESENNIKYENSVTFQVDRETNWVTEVHFNSVDRNIQKSFLTDFLNVFIPETYLTEEEAEYILKCEEADRNSTEGFISGHPIFWMTVSAPSDISYYYSTSIYIR